MSVKNNQLPEVFALHQNYPNPFNPVTNLSYDLPEDAMVSITIYDMMGKVVASLVMVSSLLDLKLCSGMPQIKVVCQLVQACIFILFRLVS